ncbi:antennal-specific protein OS-C-like [Musca vetustissima]|uniref:antennal-specific protein OS-C-like n=1 Tax=Musca vetustissima TaxID=27455 RepID=UPI002AB6DF62|nr:antennal-specific protein OS-C-like [Musca vetustissima]
MSFHLKRNLTIFVLLFIVVQFVKCQDDTPPESEEEEDDSSSEETVEDSNESGNRRRRRRSMEVMGQPVPKSQEVDTKPARAIPGLPDPAMILKIAEILTTVGQEILPVLVQGNTAVDSLVDNHVENEMKIVKNIKNQIDAIAKNLNRK